MLSGFDDISLAQLGLISVTALAASVLGGVAGACTALPCALTGVSPGQSRVVAISYALPLSYAGPDSIVATVTATSASDANPANNTATATTAVSPLADLAVVNAGPVTVVPGRTATYTVTVTNAGRGAAAAVTIDD